MPYGRTVWASVKLTKTVSIKGGPVGSNATIAFTLDGFASPRAQPNCPDCE